MTDTEVLIKEKLAAALAPIHIDIFYESHKHVGHAGAREGGGHFAVTIVSTQFTGNTLVQRYRMLFAAVDDLMKTAIHALSIQAKTPAEISQ